MKTVISTKLEPVTIAAGEFKAKCLKLMNESNEKQQAITITKHGKVVGQFVPNAPEKKPFRSLFGRTPGVSMPGDTEWQKLKQEWAEEWDVSTERLARQIKGDFSEKR